MAPHEPTTLPKWLHVPPRVQVPGLKSFSEPVREPAQPTITTGGAASRYAAPQPCAALYQPVMSGGRVYAQLACMRAR